MKKSRNLVVIGLLLFLASWVLAEEPALPILKTKAKSIAVFKNGLGFFTREGEVRLAGGWAAADLVPQASLGSLWVGVLDRDFRLEEVISLQESRSRDRTALSIPDLFRANIGRKVAFQFENKTIEGKIKALPGTLPGERNKEGVLEEVRAALPRLEDSAVVIVETSGGDVAVNKNMISGVRFLDPPLTAYPAQETVKRLKFRVSPAADKARIGLFYLQKGISWTPAYLVNLVDDKKVRITMQALLVNDIEDIEDTELLFVVGYPNFMFSDVQSPMSLTQSLSQFLSSLAVSGRREVSSGSMLNIAMQRVPELEEGPSAGLADYLTAGGGGLEGVSEEDLFFYQKKGVSLKKGERAIYPIFSELVDYNHIYEWTVPDTANVDTQGDMRRAGAERNREQVWHSLKLKNSTAQPWTTAPALALREGKPMAQDMLSYTSKGTSVNLKLTVASDVRTSRQELEAERQRDVTVYRHAYDLVTVQGELKIKNNKDIAITMDVRKSLTGEALTASYQGRIQKLAEGLELKSVNPSSRITWEVPLQPHEEITLTYTYRIYISH